MATNSQETASSSKALWPRVLVVGAILGVVGLVSARVANNPGRVEAVVVAALMQHYDLAVQYRTANRPPTQ